MEGDARIELGHLSSLVPESGLGTPAFVFNDISSSLSSVLGTGLRSKNSSTKPKREDCDVFIGDTSSGDGTVFPWTMLEREIDSTKHPFLSPPLVPFAVTEVS
mmetsp:Transcript_2459/g.4255  ORF Transcript_2459/g.4255 Transcript_2459/m.4255 type:complete len:103 (-) Transcript_2459:1241-1549(-)